MFQILKTVQGQDQDLKKMILRPVLRTTSLLWCKAAELGNDHYREPERVLNQ